MWYPVKLFGAWAEDPGTRAGQAFTLGLTSRLSLQVGHLTLASLILFSSAIAVNLSGDLIGHSARRFVTSQGELP